MEHRGPRTRAGLLSGKLDWDSKIPEEDVGTLWWDLQEGQQAKQVEMLEAIREIFTQDRRTLAQAALG